MYSWSSDSITSPPLVLLFLSLLRPEFLAAEVAEVVVESKLAAASKYPEAVRHLSRMTARIVNANRSSVDINWTWLTKL